VEKIEMEEQIKVKLLVDLTRYADGLVAGSQGYTIGSKGMWSRASDNFVTVCFPKIATLDVLWKSLEIIDEEYLKRAEESDKKWKEQLKTARCVELHTGPRGGFRSLQFEYLSSNKIINHYSNGIKSEADGIMEIFKANNIKIRKVVDN